MTEKRKPFPSVYINDALSQNILYDSYEKPCAIEELAKLCGVLAYYIEDRIRHLLKYEAMVEPVKEKYQTDFIIWSDKYGIYCEENAEKTLMPIMDDLLSALKEISRQAMKLDFAMLSGNSNEIQVPPVLCGRSFHGKLSNRKLDEMRTHQTDASLFLKLLTGKI